jgi:hypothetical protein
MSSPVDAGLLYGGLRRRYRRDAWLWACQEFLPLASGAAVAGHQLTSVRRASQSPTGAALPAPCSEPRERCLTATPAPNTGTSTRQRLPSRTTLVRAVFLACAEMNRLVDPESEAAIELRKARPAASRPLSPFSDGMGTPGSCHSKTSI